ncbi:unnamed protein product [Protopolystoma xenopodis]|uniref:Uncharacterized protein n=1 Tax=Protopolystoma xenopodis TaxID=117903 RepID=A0A3S5AQD2_9PLAT|nr:unnamed protein product [Protopolystoma xenopodis]
MRLEQESAASSFCPTCSPRGWEYMVPRDDGLQSVHTRMHWESNKSGRMEENIEGNVVPRTSRVWLTLPRPSLSVHLSVPLHSLLVASFPTASPSNSRLAFPGRASNSLNTPRTAAATITDVVDAVGAVGAGAGAGAGTFDFTHLRPTHDCRNTSPKVS